MSSIVLPTATSNTVRGHLYILCMAIKRMRLRLKVLNRLDGMAGITFGRTITISMLMSVLWLWYAWLNHMDADPPARSFELLPFGASEVIGALAAVTTGSVALQVIAQTACSKPSPTLREYSHRRVLAVLALFGPSISCTLALFVWLESGPRDPGSSLYLLVVTTLAGTNTFIAGDATDRIMRSDSENLDIQIGVARRSLARYRRNRVPLQDKVSPFVLVVIGIGQTVSTAFITLLLNAFALNSDYTNDWLAPYLLITFAAAVVTVAALASAKRWILGDASTRCLLAFFWTLGMLMVLSAAWIRGPEVLSQTLVAVLLPAAFTVAALITKHHKTDWVLPAWFPGTWTRSLIVRAVEREHAKTAEQLRFLKAKRNPPKPNGAALARFIGSLALGLLGDKKRDTGPGVVP